MKISTNLDYLILKLYIYIYIYIHLYTYHVKGSTGVYPLWFCLWTTSRGRKKAGGRARNYTQQLYADTGCSPEDMSEAIDDRKWWRERVRDIYADGTTCCCCCYIYIYIYMHVCVCVCVCVCVIWTHFVDNIFHRIGAHFFAHFIVCLISIL